MNLLLIAVVAGISLLLLSVFMDRVLVPFSARRAVRKLLKGKTKLDPRVLENPKYGKIACDSDSIGITGCKGGQSVILWVEVEEVHAFKRDLFTTDLICLAFKRAGKNEYYEVDEEMEGYHDLLEALPNRLPNSRWSGCSTYPFRRLRLTTGLFGKNLPTPTQQQLVELEVVRVQAPCGPLPLENPQ